MFHQDRVNRLPEQTQRRVYGSAASALRRGGGRVKNFRWEGEPQRRFENTNTTSQRTHSVIRIERKHPSGVPLPPTSHHIASHGTHTRYASNPRPEAISGRGLPSQRCPAAWVSGHRDLGTPIAGLCPPIVRSMTKGPGFGPQGEAIPSYTPLTLR
ncbi:hypothetical protein K469DRAFT_709370 [Zopfia rhizophila CBS 207.26]|uniref:Uncharacterized protein n=1 Tax=Zopfia rhizophila CBS 207.26 TaxID=1314779 RepID=A0A6A6ES94_9PEZI|nr:hypothetical protein K469DRAFT_709370 [Zopfia rhizophila CBS 207.26]